MNQKNITLEQIKEYIKTATLDLNIKSIKISKTFKEGDLICCAANFINNIDFFMTANDYDVKDYSGQNGYYIIKIIKK